MKIQSISQQSFKSMYYSRGIYYDLPSTFDKLPSGQIHAMNALDRKLSGSGLIGSFCPKTDLLSDNGLIGLFYIHLLYLLQHTLF